MTKEALAVDLDIAPPKPVEKRPSARTFHGTEIVDDYAWLKAANWQDVLRNPEALPTDIRTAVEAENAYVAAVLAPTEMLQKNLVAEMRARIKEDDAEVPSPDGEWLYYARHRQGGQHPLFCRKPRKQGDGEEADEIVLLDGDAEGQGKAFFEIGVARHAPDHVKLGWSLDDKGSEFYVIRVRDLDSDRDADEVVPDTDGNLVWMSDSSGFYYVRVDANHRTSQIFRHLLGTDVKDDVLVLEELDPAWFVSIKRCRSRAYALATISDHDATECYLIDLADPKAEARLVEKRRLGFRYDVEHRGERLYIRTNAGGAEDFKLVTAPLAAPGEANWVGEVAYRQGRMITAFTLFKDYLVWLEREAGLPRIMVRPLRSGDLAGDLGAEDYAIAFDEEAYHLGFERSLEFDTPLLRFFYASMTTPTEVYDYDLASRARILRKRQTIPSGHDPAAYLTRRLFANAPDGQSVPISVLYRKNLQLDGKAPMLLYGYGAYGAAIPASFSANRLSLVDRGFVYAIAHIRGGTDKGWHWYTDGKLEKKPNTFGDFVAVAEHLIEAGFTGAGRIVAQGGSAGGMLMGAIFNRAPELFAGIIADVPFVDVLNTMLDADLPLTPPEWLEWGNPIADPQAFATIKSYSPYDNVDAKSYPPLLALGGLTDPRVTYWEPLKWVTRLRATMTGGGPILLKTNMGAGHGGASGRFDRLAEVALEFAFALACVSGSFRAKA